MLTSSNTVAAAFAALAMQLLSLDGGLVPLVLLPAVFLAVRFVLAESNFKAVSLTVARPS